MDKATLELGFGFFNAAILRERLATDGEEKFFGLQCLRLAVFVFERHDHASGVLLHVIHAATSENVDVLFLEAFFELGGDFLVLQGSHTRECFENGDLRTKRVVYRCELDADSASADNDQRFRNVRQFEDRAVGENLLVIGLDAGERFGFGTTDEKNVASLYRRSLAILFDGNLSRTGVFPPALHPFDFVFLEQKLDPFGVLGDDFVFARQDVGPIDYQAGNLEPEFGAVFEVIVDIGVVKKDFRGDAADVKASAAEKGILFNYDRFETKFAGADGGNVAARTTANNCHVIFRHAVSPFALNAGRTTTMATKQTKLPFRRFGPLRRA